MRPLSRGVSWALRKDFRDFVMVSPYNEDAITIRLADADIWVAVDRPTARLLAKRINQCLDATVKS